MESPGKSDKEVPDASKKRKAEWFDIDESNSKYVYVSGLPTSFTEEDFTELMRKYGIIAKKTLPGQPLNIKLYKDKDGKFKGDALCCYARKESVDLALTHLDGYMHDDNHTVHCEPAKFEMKGDSYDPTKKPRTLDKRARLKQKKTVDKLLSWDTKRASEEIRNVVILKFMFTPQEILEEPELMVDLKDDVELKCSEVACEPKKIKIYDKHPEGVISVTFSSGDHAESCIKALDGQFYAGRVVSAQLWDGKTKYTIKETDEEVEKRLEKWHRDIQKSDDEDDQEAHSSNIADQAEQTGTVLETNK